MDRSVDQDGVSVGSNYERGLRELVKADYTRESAKNPMKGSFRAVMLNPHNLENVSGLRDKYPLEYSKRMMKSFKKPKGKHFDSQWYAHTLAGRVLAGISDNDSLKYVIKYSENDLLGIPNEFIEMPEGKKWAELLVNRSWANREVNEWLRLKLGLEKPVEEIKQTYVSNQSGFE
jgi:hypothetical protein